MCSFENLLNRISPKLKGIVYKITQYIHTFDADDLYAQATLHLWDEYQQNKLSDKTDSYILQSCYFYLKNYVRKESPSLDWAQVSALNHELALECFDTAFFNEHPIDHRSVDMDDLMEEVFNHHLGLREKEVAFFYLQGWTTREIGQRLGVSHVSIVKIQSKIREKCRQLKKARQTRVVMTCY